MQNHSYGLVQWQCLLLTSVVCPHSRVGGRGGCFPAGGIKWRQLKLGGGALIVNVASGSGGGVGRATFVATAATAVQEGSGKWLA